MDCIVNQMMGVAEYLGWDASELKPVSPIRHCIHIYISFWHFPIYDDNTQRIIHPFLFLFFFF